MKAKLSFLMSALMVLAFVVSGCHKGGDYVNVIPSDAYAVASVDLKSLIKKSDLTSGETDNLRRAMEDIFRNGVSAETLKQMETIMKTPAESGIDFESPFYIFGKSDIKEPVVLLRVSDEKKLKYTVEQLAKDNICQPLAEADGYSYTSLNGSSLMMFGKSALMISSYRGHSAYEEMKTMFTALLSQEASKSIAGSKVFSKMNDQKADIKFFANMMSMPDVYTQQLKIGLNSMDIDLSEVASIGGLTFENGSIDLQVSNYTENKEVEALLKKQAKAAKSIDRDFIGYFPKATIAFASMGVDGKKMYELLAENEELMNMLPVIDSETGKNVMSSFSGDVSVGITGMGMDGTPTFLAYADVKNNDLLDAIYDGKDFILRRNESIDKKGKNEYVYKSKNNTIYYGMKKKTLYATNDKQLFDNVCKDAKPSIEDAEFIKNMKGKSFFAAVDVSAILGLPLVKMAIGFSGASAQAYYGLASKVDYVEVSSTTDGVSNVNIVLNDKGTNSLRQIINIAGQYIGL